MRTIGVTGYKGRLGSYLTSHFSHFVPLDCDVTRPDSVKDCLKSVRPDAVLHLAAKSDVDWCENPANSDTVTKVNLRGTFNVCAAAEDLGVPVTLLSTEQVFSGRWGRYKETDKPDPVNQYGYSKLAAESLQSAFDGLRVVRTSYFFDADRLLSNKLDNYPTFISRSFIHIRHLSLLLSWYFPSIDNMPKILHLAGSKSCSWYELMLTVNRELGLGREISPRWQEVDTMAPRPKKGGLNVSLSKKLGFPQYSYLDGIKFMKENG